MVSRRKDAAQGNTKPNDTTKEPTNVQLKAEKPASKIDFIPVDHLHAHPGRKRDIISAHPEVKELIGYEYRTKYLAVVLVVVNLAITAYVGKHFDIIPAWALFLLVYFVGTPMNHACAMVIHECSHNLAATTVLSNRIIGIFVNMPMGIPSAMSFSRHHPVHHSHMGVLGEDLDLPTYPELKIVGHDSIKKLIWHSMYMFSYGLRPVGWGGKIFNKWEAFNIVFQLGVDFVMAYKFGIGCLWYMALGTFFAFGLHPCGAHFIQEHYILSRGTHNKEGHIQETFSYYGWLNYFIMNVGYHNEHHDLSTVPWTRLPMLRKLAPEFYDNLEYHTSILDIFRVFHSSVDLGPFSRVCRSYDSYKLGVKNFAALLRPGQSSKMG